MDVCKKAEGANYLALYSKGLFTETCPLEFFNTNTVVETTDNLNKANYLELLVPLLHETWLEIVPEVKLIETKQGVYLYSFVSKIFFVLISETTVLNQEAAGILNTILKVTQSLFKYYKTKQNGITLLVKQK